MKKGAQSDARGFPFIENLINKKILVFEGTRTKWIQKPGDMVLVGKIQKDKTTGECVKMTIYGLEDTAYGIVDGRISYVYKFNATQAKVTVLFYKEGTLIKGSVSLEDTKKQFGNPFKNALEPVTEEDANRFKKVKRLQKFRRSLLTVNE